MKALQILIILAVGYLLGSVLPALIIGKMVNGIDIRKYGSGNPGTTNVLRTLGIGPAILVFAIDVLKGVVATLFAKIVMPDDVVLGVTLAGLRLFGGILSHFISGSGEERQRQLQLVLRLLQHLP